MSQQAHEKQQDPPSPSRDEERASISDSEAAPDKTSGHDVFEDAVDTSSVRSLTQRHVPTSRSIQPDADESDSGRISPTNAEDPTSESKGTEEPSKSKGNEEPGESTVKEESNESNVDEHGEYFDRRSCSSSTSPKHFSTTSNLDNVNLDDDAPDTAAEGTKSPTEKDQTNKTISLSSITSALPSMPWSPPAEPSPSRSPNPLPAALAPQVSQPTLVAAAPPPPPPRKLTSPFSWLSRNSSKDKEATPAANQTSPRRNTASSVATLTSNPEMLLSRLEEEKDEQAHGESLKDRFKLLRLREEAGITAPLVEDTKGECADTPPANHSTLSEAPPPSSVPEPDATMPAGTMSGVHAGPSAMPETEVDWDLWQSVVYEGPAAVARTSAAELNRAIATGIPSAIRGVIWQVLAQSKNDELELLYKELSVKGTEKDKTRNSNSTTTSAASNTNLSVHSGDAIASSSSSVHSEHSGGAGPVSPHVDKGAEAAAKANAAENKKKEKEDAAALQKLEKTIRRDLGARTSYSKYAAAAGLQDGLFGVCKAYALYDEGVGYAQGMNFLIMPLLFNMPEQEAFCLLARLMHNYGLRDLFIQDMPGLHMRLYQFERLLEDFEPALYCHLHRRGISGHLYATQWFLTLFAYRFPLQLVLRIYDLIISEGLSAILRFGLVLMQKNAATLLSLSDMQQLTVFLKDKLFDAYIDKDPSQGSLLESGFFGSSSSNMEKEVYRADQLIRDACEIKISPETLKAYGLEWEEKTRAEKQRETELFELRNNNQHLTIKVRKLEERVEVCDREQAALATEMVHAKVENEELKDENESLKGQVRELKLVIEQQPQELEGKWALEREDLMKRNQKVHEENEELEKTLQELEEQLVQTKMRYAEINSQHETLTRKWSDLKRQFA